jgi:hypothetical protein
MEDLLTSFPTQKKYSGIRVSQKSSRMLAAGGDGALRGCCIVSRGHQKHNVVISNLIELQHIRLLMNGRHPPIVIFLGPINASL